MPERERGILSAYGLGRGWLWPVVTVIDFRLFGEKVCVENPKVTQYCSGYAQKDFLKGAQKHVGQGPHV